MNTTPAPNPLVQAPPLPLNAQSLAPNGEKYQQLVKAEEEKTIPFLRQLTDMLQHNDELISFVPGRRLPNKTILGKIIIHDRIRVQSEVLPAYFNHASFASLRRQLSYFSFGRLGKSRQLGVTYTNDAVIDLSDIHRLKRQSSGGVRRQRVGSSAAKQQQGKRRYQRKEQPSLHPPNQPEQPLTTASPDNVATFYADKSYHNLDINNSSTTNESNERDGCSLFNPVSLSSNNMNACALSPDASSSTSSSDSVPNNNMSDGGSRDRNSGCCNPKKHVHKYKRASSAAKHLVPEKDRARLKKLFSNNEIVPFIHLPVRPRRKREESTAPFTAAGDVCTDGRMVQRKSVGVPHGFDAFDLQTQAKPKSDVDRAMSACAVLCSLGAG